MDEEGYGFVYSNYGYAILGFVLEAVYDTDYTSLNIFDMFLYAQMQLEHYPYFAGCHNSLKVIERPPKSIRLWVFIWMRAECPG